MSKMGWMTLLGVALVAGCANTNAWRGAVAEKDYDKELEIKRLAEVANNDDYYEFEKSGRIYVLSDGKDYRGFRTTGELPYSTKLIGGGPGGKTIVYELTKNETKILEKNPRAQGAAQKMYEGSLKGMEKNFFAIVERDSATYVFTSWNDLQSFKAAGNATGYSESLPDGGKIVYAGATARPDVAERVSRLYAP